MKIRNIFIFAICAVFVAGCGGKSSTDSLKAERTVFAMDTVMTLQAYGENADKALDEAESEIRRLDEKLRRGSESSEIYAVNTAGGAEVSADTAKLINDALSICEATDGAFDISIAPVMDLWGFYTGEFHVPSEDELREQLDKVSYRNINLDGGTVTVSNGSEIDLGGIAKGYLSSKIMEIMEENGVSSGIISLGGNVQVHGSKPDGSGWRVAIQNPGSEEGFVGILNVTDMAVITSGGYQRFFEQDGEIYHHIIDPADGYPAGNGLESVTIVSDNGTLADGLSTALFVMGTDAASEYWRENEGFEAVFVTDDRRVIITEGLEGIFESSFEYSVITK